MNIDAVAKALSIAKDVVLVAVILAVGWRYVPLFFDESLTSNFEVSEINLLVVKLKPQLSPQVSERAISAVVADLGDPDSDAEPPGGPPSEPPAPARTDSVTYYARNADAAKQAIPINVPTEQIVTSTTGTSGDQDVELHGWSYLGTYRNGKYIEVLFDFPPDTKPAKLANTMVRAKVDVFVRDDKPRFLLGWTMGDRLGVIKAGSAVKIVELANIPAKGGGSRVWFRI